MTQRTTVLIAAALVLSAPALAGTPFSSSVLNTPSAVGGGTLFQRYFSPGSTGVSLDCSTNCGPAGCATTDGQETCQLTTRNASGGYLGYDSNSDNYYPAGTGDGNFFESVMDAQANAGTGNHVGYFAWTGKVVNSTDSSKKTDTNCAGVHSASCLGNANSNNSVGRSMVPNADGGASGVDRFGGLSPIPAPRIVSYDTTTRTIQLEWDTAQSNTGGLTAVGYDLYAFTGLVVAGSCPAPNETQLSFLRAVTGTSTAVTRAELGSVAGDNKCAVFALRPTLANIVNGTVKTRFLSQNGQSPALRRLRSATTVSSLQAQWMNAATVEVRWTTSLEDGACGFWLLGAQRRRAERLYASRT
ncbi:MAG: hypothetical protein U0V87_04630 [Acidobacteriota bacterium]